MAAKKFKTHKGLKKRVRITASGKIKVKRAGKGHLLSNKSGERLRRMERPLYIAPQFERSVKRALGAD